MKGGCLKKLLCLCVQKFANTVGQQYTHYEDMFFKQIIGIPSLAVSLSQICKG